MTSVWKGGHKDNKVNVTFHVMGNLNERTRIALNWLGCKSSVNKGDWFHSRAHRTLTNRSSIEVDFQKSGLYLDVCQQD